MQWKSHEIYSMPRAHHFPFRLSCVYSCWQWTRPVGVRVATPADRLEISIRLDCRVEQCLDELNGRPLNLPFPHVLLKRPGAEVMSTQAVPRDTIAFQYPAELQSKLEELCPLPERDAWAFTMTPAVEGLLKDYWNCLYHLYTPGTPDQLDWICFKLLGELVRAEIGRPETDEKTVMRNASVWMQIHFSEKFSVAEVAAQYHMSRASFYRAWQRCFALSPIRYILDLRLQAAATLLEETRLPISQVAANIGFGGVDAFHRKFKEKYGLTPARYRERFRCSDPVPRRLPFDLPELRTR